VLELEGPATLINAIERSLFTIGLVSARVHSESDVFVLQPELLGALTALQTQSGLLTLVIRENDSDELVARVENESISADASEPMRVLSAVHKLLHKAGILVSAERANL
jgi:hypothetical protein